jgi:hypothetical protein
VGTRGASEAFLRWEVGAGAAGTRGASGAALRREVGAGAMGTRGGSGAAVSRVPLHRPLIRALPHAVVPVMLPDNPHRMITWGKTSFKVVPGRLVLTAATSSPTLSPIPSSARTVLADLHWRAAMQDEYGALISNGTWELVPRPQGSNIVTSKCVFTPKLRATIPLIATRLVGSFGVSLSTPESTTMRPSTRL